MSAEKISSVPLSADDQKAEQKDNTREHGEKFHEGKANEHDNQDPKDQRSIKNTLAAAEHDEHKSEEEDDTKERKPVEDMKRGARIDVEIEDEEAALIAKMDEKKRQKEENKHK